VCHGLLSWLKKACLSGRSLYFYLGYFQNAGEQSVANLDKIRHNNGDIPTADLRLKLQKAMQDKAAVFRTGQTLAEGVQEVNQIVKDFDNIKV
jgi:succinate dehydrogenase/fumarate reductase flavoprotein subunit